MSTAFLSEFMKLAQAMTRAERSVAVDVEFHTQDTINIEESVLASTDFTDMVASATASALEKGEAVITNNMITDPNKAPETNIHLSNLRLVVALPLAGYGAVYLDQSVRQGVFERDAIDKLMQVANQVISSGNIDLSQEELTEIYESL